MLHSFCTGTSTHDVYSGQDITLFSNVLMSLNKYEICLWKQQKEIHCNSSSDHDMKRFFAFIQHFKTDINKLLPESRAFIIDIIGNNIMCIKETGLLAKHALSHIREHLEDVGITAT